MKRLLLIFSLVALTFGASFLSKTFIGIILDAKIIKTDRSGTKIVWIETDKREVVIKLDKPTRMALGDSLFMYRNYYGKSFVGSKADMHYYEIYRD